MRDQRGRFLPGHAINLGKTIPNRKRQPLKDIQDLSYRGLHDRVRSERGKPTTCVCDTPRGRFEWHCPKGLDPFDPQNYVSRCQGCHKLDDLDDQGRANMSQAAKARDAAGKRTRNTRGQYA